MNSKPAVTFLAKAPSPKATTKAIIIANLKDSFIFVALIFFVLLVNFFIGF